MAMREKVKAVAADAHPQRAAGALGAVDEGRALPRAAVVAPPHRADAALEAVAHSEFSSFTMSELNGFYGSGKKILLDLKGLLNRKEYESAGYLYWRL